MAWSGMYHYFDYIHETRADSAQEYHPDDLKGKGEPSYTIEKALKDHKRLGDTGTEMKTRHSHSRSVGHVSPAEYDPTHDAEAGAASGIGRSNSTSVGSALKKRFGSIRRRKQDVAS